MLSHPPWLTSPSPNTALTKSHASPAIQSIKPIVTGLEILSPALPHTALKMHPFAPPTLDSEVTSRQKNRSTLLSEKKQQGTRQGFSCEGLIISILSATY